MICGSSNVVTVNRFHANIFIAVTLRQYIIARLCNIFIMLLFCAINYFYIFTISSIMYANKSKLNAMNYVKTLTY